MWPHDIIMDTGPYQSRKSAEFKAGYIPGHAAFLL